MIHFQEILASVFLHLLFMGIKFQKDVNSERIAVDLVGC